MFRVFKATLIFSIVGWFLSAFAGELKPSMSFVADDNVNDIALFDHKILAGTDGGTLIQFDIEKNSTKTLIKLDKIKDFMGDMIDAKIFSVDYIDGKYLILSDSGDGGFANLYILQNGRLTNLIDSKKRLAIIKAKFVNREEIFFMDLGSVAYLLDIKSGKIIYSKQLSGSKFSDFDMDVDRQRVAVAGESGILRILDIKSCKVMDKIEGLHLDNIFSVSFEKSWIVSGSQDRRAGYFNIDNGTKGFFKGGFLVYATAISPDEKLFAYAMDSDNSITIFDSVAKKRKMVLKGQKSILTVMKFLDEETLVSASHDDTIMVWKLR
jgi:WD40 repeat protein